MAKESTKSLGKGNFEVLLFVDDDDEQLEAYKELESKSTHVLIRPRLSYYRFHEMINELCKHAKGDWLLLWNDDAFMHGQWIHHLDEYDPNKVNVMRWGHSSNGLNLFPAISRKMYEVQGYFSMSPHCDSWAMDISKELSCERWVEGMTIEHRRDESSLADDTKAHSMEAYSVTVPQHGSGEVQGEMRRAIEMLKEYV